MPEDKYIITATLRTAKQHNLQSPPLDEAEAQRQLGLIRDDLGSARKPELTWMTAVGKDIIGAGITKASPFAGMA